MADGASTSARSEVWSEILVNAFTRDGVDPLAPDVLDRLRQAWWKQVARPGLPWWAVEKLPQGAAAAFVGLTVRETGYRVRAIGDSCLFHLRGEEILLAGPLDRADRFSRFPALITTRPHAAATVAIWEGGGSYDAGDVFVLATDAMAKHLLQDYQTAGRLLPVAKYLESPEAFGDFVARARENGMDNDDTTACVVQT
ncbi:hypothetical protein BJ970_006965 [Saccharopolyspora phatthalungensis]|uniref:PPM-type phosphatase domain-containing protein n=1 Tax=Saccharopolyspora phatthalungensis TaxID=664693 RepID=A0A840QFZ0_9PSEU|nr:hypothetical protein [Saccharopolyspora phatthalungensis]